MSHQEEGSRSELEFEQKAEDNRGVQRVPSDTAGVPKDKFPSPIFTRTTYHNFSLRKEKVGAEVLQRYEKKVVTSAFYVHKVFLKYLIKKNQKDTKNRLVQNRNQCIFGKYLTIKRDTKNRTFSKSKSQLITIFLAGQ